MSQPSRVPRADVPSPSSPPSPPVPPRQRVGRVWAGLRAPTVPRPGAWRPDAELAAHQLFWWGPPRAAEFWGAQSPKAQAAGPKGTHAAPQSRVIIDVLTKVRCKSIQKRTAPALSAQSIPRPANSGRARAQKNPRQHDYVLEDGHEVPRSCLHFPSPADEVAAGSSSPRPFPHPAPSPPDRAQHLPAFPGRSSPVPALPRCAGEDGDRGMCWSPSSRLRTISIPEPQTRVLQSPAAASPTQTLLPSARRPSEPAAEAPGLGTHRQLSPGSLPGVCTLPV